MKSLVPGEAYAAMHLYAEVADFTIRVARVCLRHRNGQGSLFCVIAHQPGGVVNSRPRALCHQKHVSAVMLNSLKLSDWFSELLASLCVFDRCIKHPLHAADHLCR